LKVQITMKKSDQLKISIVIPSYNQAQYLSECLESIVSQTYKNYEIIVIDGGSQDGSVDVIKKYSDKISYWQSEKDGGQTNAINIGFSHASGDIFAWLNSDDRYRLDAFALAVEQFNKSSDLDLLYGDQGLIDSEGVHLGMIKCIPCFSHLAKFGGVGFPQPSTFFSKKAFQAIGDLREELEYQMDTEFFLRFVRNKMVIKPLYVCLADFRLHPDSKTVRTDRAVFMEENFRLREAFLPKPFKHPQILNIMKWITRIEGYLIRSLLRGIHQPFKGTTN